MWNMVEKKNKEDYTISVAWCTCSILVRPRVLFKHELLDWSFTCVWSHGHVKLHASLFVQSDFQSLGFKYPRKLIWWAYLSCTRNPKRHIMLCSCMVIAQCSAYSSIRHYSADVFWLSINPLTNWSNLDHSRQWVESIRHWSLGKAWIWIDQTCISDWNHPTVIVHCLALLVYIVSTSCAHCCLFHIPILIHRWQLTVNCATTHHISNSNDAK